ncbi:hypothetical protein OH77DRAFT_1363640, partial [Trametes cingulata]
LLLWIKGTQSPQVIRDRVLAENGFRAELISWLESCQMGGYSHSTEDAIRSSLSRQRQGPRPETLGSAELEDSGEELYRDPISIVPIPPPPAAFQDNEVLKDWYHGVCTDADEIVYLSNRHDARHSKGCLRGKTQYCRARFPREVRPVTMVDPDNGALRFKQTDPWLNTYNPILSYLLRCNTDVSCLLSGTQVRAIIAYVTDYVTKAQLKTYSVFEAVKSV